MESSNLLKRWYAVQVRPRHEKAAALNLESKGLECLLPLYRAVHHWSDRQKILHLPLFPGYVFCRFEEAIRVSVLTCPGVVRVVGAGRRPVPVEEQEIASLRAVAHSGLHAKPWEFLQAGQTVRIVQGPLTGVEGLLVRRRSDRFLVVSIALLQRSVAVQVESDWVVPTTVSPPLPIAAARRDCYSQARSA